MDTLIERLSQDYPDAIFIAAERFMFTPPSTIQYSKNTDFNSINRDSLLLLHELSHFILQHQDYGSELDLLKMEAQAWAKAKQLADKYQTPWDEDVKDDYLDSYRELLHRRSICPNCQINGFFSATDHIYHCPSCQKTWR